jgi:hypothetical protein
MPVERKQLPSTEQPFDLPKPTLNTEPDPAPASLLSGGFTLLPLGILPSTTPPVAPPTPPKPDTENE